VGFAVGEGHEVAVGCAGSVEVVGSFPEFLAQVEDLLFKLANAGAESLGVVGAPDSAGTEDFFAEGFREPGRELGVLLAEPLVLLTEVRKVREQRPLALTSMAGVTGSGLLLLEGFSRCRPEPG
jgi:hypothetical protein